MRATDAFTPLTQSHVAAISSRPSLSYWQDAWMRLQQNKRATFSLYLIIGLLLFTFIGPFIWTVDPSAQDVDQISIAPGADRSATLIEDYQPWYGDTANGFAYNSNALGLTFARAPSTQAVRLVWQDQSAAGGYRIYRNLFPITPGGALGLPLAETQSMYFEDRLDLRPIDYHYSIVALDERGDESDLVATLSTTLTRVITRREAERRGLMAVDAQIEYGHEFKLGLHPLGTDYLGRDMLARLMHGARVSLFIGLFAPILYILFGVLYGSIAGFVGGMTDQLMMRFADFVVALPFLLFMILFKIVFGIGPGESGIMPMLVAMVVLLWPAAARLVRGQVLQIREEGYIGASRLLGAKTPYLLLRHMIPNTMGVILVTVTFAVPSAIFTEAFLSFIGMGVAPPTPSWGSMCNEGIKTMLTHPHELIFPALFISITVLAFNLLGDGLRDALDARMRNRE
jgi:oligopeptide transport system permease protein